MQGGPGPGRGIYVTRRVLAALVVLLLLVLLVPWACQNLIGSGEQPGSGSSETADVDPADSRSRRQPADHTARSPDGAGLSGAAARSSRVAARAGGADYPRGAGTLRGPDSL